MSALEVSSSSTTPKVCSVCGVGDDGRRLCHFVPTEEAPQEIYLHVFCGKTAAILPHVNRPDLEILTKAGVKNKHGTGVSVTLALQRCRSAKINDPSNREQEYFLSKEFERIYHSLTREPTVPLIPPPPTDTHDIDQLNFDDIANVDIHQHVPNPMYSTEELVADATVTPEQIPVTTTSSFQDHVSFYPQDDIAQEEPPTKKAKTSTETITAAKSPYDVAMEKLQEVCNRCEGVGYSLVRGVATATSENDYDEEDDEESFDPTKCSQAQVDHVRVIVITKERQERLDEMGRLVLGDQFGSSIMSFSKSYSYHVLHAWTRVKETYLKQRDWTKKFDLLLGFTNTINEHNTWIHDHEVGWGGEKMLQDLGRCWRLVLAKSDEDLGIDTEYTRPGVIALLDQLKEEVESASESQVDELLKFNFA